MDQNGTVFRLRNRQSASSDRFLGVCSPTKPSSLLGDDFSANDELNEDDILWNRDFTEPPASPVAARQFRTNENSGILAALAGDVKSPNSKQPLLQRKTSLSPTTTSFLMSKSPLSGSPTQSGGFSRLIPSIPKPQGFNGYSQSMPMRKFSAPMNVPIMPRKKNGPSLLAEVELDDHEAEDEMLPPHEMVARGTATRSPRKTFSMLEGAGRTLKGRDLRQVRNAVWRQTGFLD